MCVCPHPGARLCCSPGRLTAFIHRAQDYGCTPLILASESGHEVAVALLIEAGANLEAKNEHGSTSLILATHNDHVPVVALLLEAAPLPLRVVGMPTGSHSHVGRCTACRDRKSVV